MSPDAQWFDRPRLVEQCGACGGCGAVVRPYALAQADHVIDAPNGAILAIVRGSAHIRPVCEEASEIARRSGRCVAFRFIDHTVVVGPEDDWQLVAEQWWKKQYGETSAQTMARR